MSSSLYDISVSNYLQILGSTINVLDKGAQQGADNNLDLDALLEYRLRPDMSPFPFQVISVMHHSRGAIEGIVSGLFTPPKAARGDP